jgi:hypothetical protein
LKIIARGRSSAPAATLQGVPILLPWGEHDCVERYFDAGDVVAQERSKWNMLLGAVIVLGISGGFWTAVGLMIARLLR